jgi:CheY-like chemotaxis protein
VTSKLPSKGQVETAASSHTDIVIDAHALTSTVDIQNRPHDDSSRAEDEDKPTLLIVDDTEGVLETCAHEMRDLGFEVVTALGPILGLESMKRRSYDLILCDFKMPHQNGAELTSSFRHWERLHRGLDHHQKIYALTAYPASAEAECIAAGMDGVLPKPVQPDRVNEIIHGAGLPPLGRPADG